MKLTKKELIQKLINCEKLYATNRSKKHYCYYDENKINPFRYFDIELNQSTEMNSIWEEEEWDFYQEKPDVYGTPKNGEKAYLITTDGKVIKDYSWYKDFNRRIINQGSVFKTKEEAENEVKLREAKCRVKQRIWELNGGKFIGFKNDSNNWSFELREELIIAKTWCSSKFYPNWQYLKSKELAEQLIEEMRDDLLLIRGE